MALPATDNFTAANATPLSTYNSSWTVGSGALEIRDNKANAVTDQDSYGYWNADTFDDDQYSKAKISGQSVAGTEFRGVCARAAGSGGTFRCYLVYTDGVTTDIGKVVANVYSSLKAFSAAFANDDEIEIRCTGTTTTTIAVYKNGVFVDSVADSSSPHTNGAAGIYAYGNTPGVDDWEGGNLTGGTQTTVTPAQAALSIGGHAPATSAFQNVRIREVLVNGSGQPVGNATGINLLVWYAGFPSGAPDVSLNGMTTDANGSASWSIPTGPLSYNQPVFYVATSGDTSPSAYTCARMTPSYE